MGKGRSRDPPRDYYSGYYPPMPYGYGRPPYYGGYGGRYSPYSSRDRERGGRRYGLFTIMN
jgi:hypothetical protein